MQQVALQQQQFFIHNRTTNYNVPGTGRNQVRRLAINNLILDDQEAGCRSARFTLRSFQGRQWRRNSAEYTAGVTEKMMDEEPRRFDARSGFLSPSHFRFKGDGGNNMCA